MVIDSRESLEAFSRRIGLLEFGASEPLELRIEQFSTEKNQKLQTRLNRFLNACGCGWAAALAVSAPVLFGSFLLSGRDAGLAWSAATLFGLFLAGGAAGKLIGRMIAREKLRRQLSRLLGSLPQT